MDQYTQLGAALWLMPPNGSPLSETLKTTIDGLRPLVDDGQRFSPHVTIVTKILISNQAQADFVLDQALIACKSVPQMKITLKGVKYGSRYFKKVYLGVEPSPELISLARISKEEFVTGPAIKNAQKHYHALSIDERSKLEQQAAAEADQWVRSEYDPHLSLVYSNQYPVDEALKVTISTRVTDIFGSNINKGISWTGGRLALVDCEGPVEDWRVLGYRDIH